MRCCWCGRSRATDVVGCAAKMLQERVIDTDIHATVPSVEALFPYLAEHWREYIRTSAFKGPVDSAYPANAPTTRYAGAQAPTSVEVVRTFVLDAQNVEIGI